MADGQWDTVVRFLRGVADAGRAEEWTDGQLLERFLGQRDGEAFAALVRRHAGLVLGVCRRILPVLQDAEDAFQATFLLLAKQAGTISRRESVGSWLHGVARRVSLRARAGIARRRERERQAEPPAQADAFGEVVRRDLAAVLDEEVRRLPERCRAPFVLCYLEGRTNAEAARLLGCPKGTVLSRLARARQLLRARLVRRGLGVSGGLAAPLLETTAAPASVPAALLGETIRAVLASVPGNGATALAEGVIQAMKIAKLKFFAIVLLALGAVGGGIGWLTHRAGGGEPAVPKAEGPKAGVAPAKAEPDGAAAPEAQAKQLNKAMDEVKALEKALQDKEEQWRGDATELRMKVIGLEEKLQRLEREQAEERDRERADRDFRAARVRRLEATLDELSATEKVEKSTVEETAKKLGAMRRELDRLIERSQWGEERRSKSLVEARTELMWAEERLRSLERRQAHERARLQARLEAADERVQQLQGVPARRGPSDRQQSQVEGKLDQVLRELAELRRDLRRPPAPKPPEPGKP